MDSVEDYIRKEFTRLYLLAEPYYWHEVRWGVPCGPTLAMLPPMTWNERRLEWNLPWKNYYELSTGKLRREQCARAMNKQNHLPHQWHIQPDDDTPIEIEVYCGGYRELIGER